MFLQGFHLKIRWLLTIFLALAGFCSAQTDETHCDLILRNGLVVDGTGLPPYKADVGISDGKIIQIGDLNGIPAEKRIDATGLVVMPGIIDILCHNDLLWTLKEQERAIRQGVTSGLAGNCGFSILDVEKNLVKLQKHRGLLNLGTLIAHGSVRNWFVRDNRNRPTSLQDITKMKIFVEGALKAGAFGLSSGLGYEPGLWCRPAELQALASVLTRYPHAAYYTHIRNYRSNVLEAVDEAIQIAETTKVPVVIQHLLFKLPSNWDQTESGLRLIEQARAKGLSVYASVYPYDFWGNEVQIPLSQFLYLNPGSNGWDFYLQKDKTEETLALIRKRLQEYGGGDKIEITKVASKSFKDFLGYTVKEMATQRKISEEQVILALLLENGSDVKICYHGLSEEGLIKKIQAPYMLFGSDSSSGIAHPRDVGAFPRLLGKYVRDKRAIRLSEAVHRLTEEPAKLMGLKDRGLLKKGYWADVVLMDYRNINDKATAVNYLEQPQGIKKVWVNGRIVYDDKAGFSGLYPGQVLRRSND
jgi:N-acyl-D-aspartate/D-glutamate deacylase